MRYLDRRSAGRTLAEHLSTYAGPDTLVVALPRGGVPVAFEVARALALPLGLLVVRKLGAPGNPELAVGAIAEGGTTVIDGSLARRTGMTPALLDETIARESRELERRVALYRAGRPPLAAAGRTVILVDDGVATGLTDLVAVRALRAAGAARVVVAVPVGAGDSLDALAAEADDVVCPLVPDALYGVGRWYRDFAPTSDEEVLALLEQARSR